MAKLKSYKRIITSDYEKKDQALIETLGLSVNDGFNSLFFAMNGRLTFGDNIAATVKDVDITVDANGIPINRTTIALNTTDPVIMCLVGNVVNQTNTAAYPTGAPFVSFTQLDTGLLINHITGLQANNRYTIRIIAIN